MSLADVFTPVSGFKSTIPTFSCHRNARVRPRASRLVPTTWPARFTAFAWLTAPSLVPGRSWFAPFLWGVAERVGGRSRLAGFGELVARPTPRNAGQRLGAVRRKPGGIVALCAPPARVEGRSAIRDPEES